jgi:CRISPR-associated exonuclease Cas4
VDDDPIPISAIQHAVCCLRQAGLIHVERMWEENRLIAEGRVLHAATDKLGYRYSRGVRRVAAMPLASRRLGLAGIADVVEFRRSGDTETPYPLEFKHGKPKAHHADEAQLCAQGLCLEDMTGRPVPEGALFYGETRRRVEVRFDEDLRRLTESAVGAVRDLFASCSTPPA